MTKRRTSFAFLMEMLWVCGFFILSACIFVLAFVKADQLSRHASNLNQAVVAVENAVESTFSLYSEPLPDGTKEERELYFDNGWTLEDAPGETPDSYRIVIHTSWQDGLLTVQASALDETKSSGDSTLAEELYSLDAVRYYPLHVEERSAE